MTEVSTIKHMIQNASIFNLYSFSSHVEMNRVAPKYVYLFANLSIISIFIML